MGLRPYNPSLAVLMMCLSVAGPLAPSTAVAGYDAIDSFDLRGSATSLVVDGRGRAHVAEPSAGVIEVFQPGRVDPIEVFGFGGCPGILTATPHRVWAYDDCTNSIYSIDTATSPSPTLLGSVSSGPADAMIVDGQSRLYISTIASHVSRSRITVVDGWTLEEIRTIPACGSVEAFMSVRIENDGRDGLLITGCDGLVRVIDPMTGTSLLELGRGDLVAVDQLGHPQRLLVGDSTSPSVQVFEGDTLEPTATIMLPALPLAMALTFDRAAFALKDQGRIRITSLASGGSIADLPSRGSVSDITFSGGWPRTTWSAGARLTRWIEDDTAPQTRIVSLTNAFGQDGHQDPTLQWSSRWTLTLDCSDDFACARINPGASVTYEREGIHQVRYFSADRAGNVETPRTLTLGVDATEPDNAFFTADGAVIVAAGTPPDESPHDSAPTTVLRGFARDSLAGVENVVVAFLAHAGDGVVPSGNASVSIQCGPQGECHWTATPPLLVPGRYRVVSIARDAAGNARWAAPIDVIVI